MRDKEYAFAQGSPAERDGVAIIRQVLTFIFFSAVLPAVAAMETRHTLPALWMSAELPSAWVISAGESGFEPKTQPDGKNPLGINVQWMEGEEAEMKRFFKSRYELAPWQLKTRGAQSIKAGPQRRQGAWLMTEISEKKLTGEILMTLEAVLAAPGGFYAVGYFARESHYAAHRPAALRFMESFRREAPRLSFAPYSDPGGRFEVSTPTAPWTSSEDATEGVLRFIGPAGPGRTPPPIMSLRRIPPGSAWKNALDLLRSQAPKGAVWSSEIKVPSGTALVTEYVNIHSTSDMPEMAGHPNFRFHTRAAVLEKGGHFYYLTLLSAPATQADWAPAFKRALESLRIK